MPTPTLWSKDFEKGTLANFFLLLNLFLLLVVISAYAMERLDSSYSEAGFATGIFIIGALISRLFSGQLIDRMGRKKMEFTGTSLSLTMTILYLVSNNIWTLCVVRFFHGVGYGIASVAIVTVIVNILPNARKGEGIGYYMMGTILATAIGPFLAMAIMQHGGFTLIFIVGVIFALLSIGSAFALLISSVFLGLGFGIIQACGMATALKGTPPHQIGFASSTFYVFVDLGVGMGPFIVGLFIPHIGYRGMYMSMAGFSFACIFVYYLLHGRKACVTSFVSELNHQWNKSA